MAVTIQTAAATADGSGDAVFMFPEVPTGELWIGTVSIPEAPATTVGRITVGGAAVGTLFGPGLYGPYIGDHTRRVGIVATGLTPNEQFQAVWHADDQGQKFTTWPGTVSTTVEGTVVIPTPVDVDIVAPLPVPVDGTVTANQGTPGSSPWPVTSTPDLAGSAVGGSVTMTGGPDTLPNHAATEGVTLSAPKTNTDPITLNGGFVIEPEQMTPVFPVDNSDVFTATGTSGDVLSFLVT